MIIDDVQRLLDKYQAWLKDRTVLRQVNDWVEITTPYLDRHNDYIQIYAQKNNGDYLLTDDGWVIEDLIQSGCTLESPKRQSLLRMTVNGFGVQLRDDKLQVVASAENFALKKHSLVQAMLAINDLFYLAAPVVTSLFYEDVVRWLESNDIRYIPKVKFTGRSGYDHLFDFVIPKSRKYPERVLKAINHPTKDSAQALAFSWIDTKDVRPPDSRAYAFLNDIEVSVSAGVVSAIRSYDVFPVLWSRREEATEQLAS
jgi:uncharacterized protein DUF1829/uncharacterized protein DUF1828